MFDTNSNEDSLAKLKEVAESGDMRILHIHKDSTISDIVEALVGVCAVIPVGFTRLAVEEHTGRSYEILPVLDIDGKKIMSYRWNVKSNGENDAKNYGLSKYEHLGYGVSPNLKDAQISCVSVLGLFSKDGTNRQTRESIQDLEKWVGQDGMAYVASHWDRKSFPIFFRPDDNINEEPVSAKWCKDTDNCFGNPYSPDARYCDCPFITKESPYGLYPQVVNEYTETWC